MLLLHTRDEERKNIPNNVEKDVQWQEMSRVFIEMLYELTDKAIEQKKGELVATGLRCFPNIADKVIRVEYLGNLQKRDIISWCYYRAEDLTLKSAQEGLYKSVLGLSPFKSSEIFRALQEDTEFSKIPLVRFSETLIQLIKEEIPSNYDLNVLGAVGRMAIDRIDECCLYKEALLFILSIFSELKELLEPRDDNFDAINAYFEVLGQVKSLKKIMEDKNKQNDKIKKEILNILRNYKTIEEFGIRSGNKTIKWPNLREK
ncbi:MAG: hypothetical protein PVF58_15350 [Candidatus Methanofastidiosia archaeon]|jgi:hypothetical protein